MAETQKPEKVINVSVSAEATSITLKGPKNELYVYVKDKQLIGCTYGTNVVKASTETLGLSEPIEPMASGSSKETTAQQPQDTVESMTDANPPIGDKKETPDEYRERRFKTAAPPGVYGELPTDEPVKYESEIEGDDVEPEPLEKPLKEPILETLANKEEPGPVKQPSSDLITGEASVEGEVSDDESAGTEPKKKSLKDLVAGDELATTEKELYSEDDD
jgi:hypothetical protein